MTIWYSSCTAAVAAALVLAPAASANPATADLFNWQGPCFGCYNYATNKKTVFYAQPNGGVQMPITCASMTQDAMRDGLVPIAAPAGGGVPDCPAGQCLVALSVDPTARGNDFHWYRLNGDNTWSDKSGSSAAQIFAQPLANGMPVDMATANRGRFATFCGYFCVPANPRVLAGADNWLRLGLGFRAFFLSYSGLANPVFDALDSLGALLRLPTGAAIADPQWPSLAFAPDGNLGFSLLPDQNAGFTGAYYQVYNGVVAVHATLDGPESILYYADNNGLEAYLGGLIPAPGTSAAMLTIGVAVMARRRR